MSNQRSLETYTDVPWEASSDIVVVGGGGAGLAAAIGAAKHGASVIILEKTAQLGGTSAMAIGSISAAGTSLQRSQGIDDSPQSHFEDLPKFAPHLEEKNNAELMKLLTAEAANTLEWLRGFGVSFYGVSPEPPNRVPRMHNVVPGMKFCIRKLEKAAQRAGCRILNNHEVTKLIQGDQGKVIGVIAVDRSGSKETNQRYRADKAVVLACGDYSSNPRLKQEFLPPGMAEIDGINDNATGDGHRLGMGVGADVVNMDLRHGPELRFMPSPRSTLRDFFFASPLLSKIATAVVEILPRWVITRVAKEMLVSWQHPEDNLFAKGAILINSHGRRFTDETRTPAREIDLAKQPGRIGYLVFDHPIAAQFNEWPNYVSTAPDIAYAYLRDYKRFRPDIFFEASDWEDLSLKIFGARRDVLRQTIGDYNAAVTSKGKDAWGRQRFAEPLVSPPFYALGPLKACIPTTEGGLRINSRFQVLTRGGGCHSRPLRRRGDRTRGTDHFQSRHRTCVGLYFGEIVWNTGCGEGTSLIFVTSMCSMF